MTTIRHVSTLFYYEGHQVFEGRDAIGGHYIAVMIEPEGEQDRYVVAGVEPERMRQFRSGLIDLRNLLVERAIEEWFLAVPPDSLAEPIRLQPTHGTLLASGFLPDDGFLLFDTPSQDLALQEARERNNLVLEVAVEPPEAAAEHRIRMDTLAGLLKHVQSLVKYAYQAALRDLSDTTRRRIDRSQVHLLDVVIPATTGSFRFVCEAAKQSDMFHSNELYRGLERVDVLFEAASNPERALQVVRENRGHLAGAYLRLLKFLIQHNTGLRYSWAEPTFSHSRQQAISEVQAIPVVARLSGISNLGSEEVSLVGRLDEADVSKRTWRISTDEGDFSGEVNPGGPSLEGLTLGRTYKFSCIEEIEEHEGTGRERRRLFLFEYRAI